jgi:hypothetical protein
MQDAGGRDKAMEFGPSSLHPASPILKMIYVQV